MIQLHLKNIGPIDSMDINVDSDLTFIYGKNNIGKSYAITILYLVLKNFVFNPSISTKMCYYNRTKETLFASDDEIINDTKAKMENSDEFDITNNVVSYFSRFISSMFLSGFENLLHNSFGDISNLKNKMSKASFYLGIEFKDYIIHITEENNKLIARYDGKGKKYLCRRAKQYEYPKTEQNQVILYFTEEYRSMGDIQTCLDGLYESSLRSITSKASDIYYLPASRSGLYRALNAFGPIMVELTKKRNYLSEKIVLPSISEQDADYFSRISEINTDRKNKKLNTVAETIEKKLLKGKVNIDPATKQILFQPNNTDINLELLGTSSMVAEVSPIVLFLRHIISSEETSSRMPILFIEEPEAHLHPEAQVVLLHCFADLVKMGVKLIITSHSNYMFQKLNNLIAEKKIDKEIINGIVLFQGEKGSCSKIIPISDIGMEDFNFVDVAEDLYNEKIQIIEKMEEDDVRQDQD